MSTQLLYHPPFGARGVSVFDEAALEVVAGQHVKIVCPFIGLDYFSRLIAQSRSWCLLTDPVQWLASQSRRQRSGIVDFIADNCRSIKSISAVHAKVIIGGGRVMFGSANLTSRGICERVEFGVVVDDRALFDECMQWFDSLWSAAEAVDVEECREVLDVLPEPVKHVQYGKKPTVSVRAALKNIDVRMPAGQHGVIPNTSVEVSAEHDVLLARVKRLTSVRAEAKIMLDCLAEALAVSGLSCDDRRLYVSCLAGSSLHVNISSLAVAWSRRRAGVSYLCIMLADVKLARSLLEKFPGVELEEFKGRPCWGVRIPLPCARQILPEVRASWHEAIQGQVALVRRDGKSHYNSYRDRHHVPWFYDFLASHERREWFVRSAFPGDRG
jgi:hypothetical protein